MLRCSLFHFVEQPDDFTRQSLDFLMACFRLLMTSAGFQSDFFFFQSRGLGEPWAGLAAHPSPCGKRGFEEGD